MGVAAGTAPWGRDDSGPREVRRGPVRGHRASVGGSMGPWRRPLHLICRSAP